MENVNSTSQNNEDSKLDFKDSMYATGKRKRSIARIWLKKRFWKNFC